MATNDETLKDLREILFQFAIPKEPSKIGEYSSKMMDELYRIWKMYKSSSYLSEAENKYEKFSIKCH